MPSLQHVAHSSFRHFCEWVTFTPKVPSLRATWVLALSCVKCSNFSKWFTDQSRMEFIKTPTCSMRYLCIAHSWTVSNKWFTCPNRGCQFYTVWHQVGPFKSVGKELVNNLVLDFELHRAVILDYTAKFRTN